MWLGSSSCGVSNGDASLFRSSLRKLRTLQRMLSVGPRSHARMYVRTLLRRARVGAWRWLSWPLFSLFGHFVTLSTSFRRKKGLRGVFRGILGYLWGDALVGRLKVGHILFSLRRWAWKHPFNLFLASLGATTRVWRANGHSKRGLMLPLRPLSLKTP